MHGRQRLNSAIENTNKSNIRSIYHYESTTYKILNKAAFFNLSTTPKPLNFSELRQPKPRLSHSTSFQFADSTCHWVREHLPADKRSLMQSKRLNKEYLMQNKRSLALDVSVLLCGSSRSQQKRIRSASSAMIYWYSYREQRLKVYFRLIKIYPIKVSIVMHDNTKI